MMRWAVPVLVAARVAAAEPADTTAVAPDAHERVAAGAGMYAVDSAAGGFVMAGTAWDGARRGMGGRVAADLAITSRLSVIGGANAEAGGGWRPYAGAKLELARGVAVSAAYRSEGFVEPEGELELGIVAGHRAGGAYLLGNAVYGQDVDSRNRDAEVGGAVVASLGDVIASMSSRARLSLGGMELGARWDAVADVGAALPVGRYAARAAVGMSALAATHTTVGPLASLTVSAYF